MATSIPSTCAVVDQQLIVETGRITPPVFQRAVAQRPWVGLMAKNRGSWQNGVGTTVSVATFERAFPASSSATWTDIGASDGADANACLPPVEKINFGTTTRSYTPQHDAKETDDFCIRDIQSANQFTDFLKKITRVLGNVMAWNWANRYVNEYRRLSGHHLTLSNVAGVQDHASSYNTTNLPTAHLSQGVLDDAYLDIMREGGEEPFAFDSATGAPVFTLVTSAETSRKIIRDNADLRQDIRFAWQGEKNLMPTLLSLGVGRKSYGGYVHMIDPFPPRYTFYGGAYHQVEPFIESSTTKGNKWELNPAYKNAPFEESFIWHQETYRSLAVNNLTNPAPGFSFNPVNYMGDFRWVNEYHRTCNPDRTIGFFRAVFADASQPGHPQLGYAIIHARCGIELDLTTCYES